MVEVEWLSEPEQQMWRGYLDSTRLLLRALDRQLEVTAAISFADYEVLGLLSEAPQRRLRMSEIAGAAVTTRSGVTRAVNRLAHAGWLRRVPCPEDKRGLFAELTEAGFAKLQSAAPGHVATVRRNVFDLLSPRDVRLFTHAYAEIRAHLLDDAEHPD
ncbi:MarR family winged helix-turn-helix transcriptional regulator [Mycolicibacterium holsaticum]|jgi:DNA-binding MarR family transcriptional regulator|uniref:MarR family winged helix-turn-helix transcriptional regulator n=1 Tax=Mycolicibacterium holsaticum TaxID=152142 RepID=UPI0016BAC0A2|nr:MarR family transcriptional regulator [Mycolicibacterium holsaticum]MDA4105680.1 MarR family transcriptional regulator [Mycolicibacterium holsaticum DSM 44478 = JCM 12374]NLG55073.1 MarR family transcriptional regulator [Rhodococcus sp. (in: high G+C Gram-positive bacteria)]QZA13944.1 MarR family transcriptional regulator [Mycolicibacterium holsaticum DSM 44478 = JCM 12374]UNC08595.1 MarR family transcriptional regulator [Mycolicibacterium holsaticum DSM 44478 = JCM 12374]